VTEKRQSVLVVSYYDDQIKEDQIAGACSMHEVGSLFYDAFPVTRLYEYNVDDMVPVTRLHNVDDMVISER
jgi:hypothetical protein